VKQSFKKDFYLLSSTINKAAARCKTMVFFKNCNAHNKVLSLLLKEGYILAYQIYKGFIVVRLRSSHRGIESVAIGASSRIGRDNLTVKLKDIKKLQQRSGSVSTLLLSTDKGILSSTDAIEKGVGGKILFKIR
jgi:ribosomal protein S8